MFCTKCGAQLPEDAEFCTNCGTKLKGAAGAVNQIPVQQKPAAAVTPQAVSEQAVHGQVMPTQKAVNNNRNKIAKPLVIMALLLCVIAAVWYSKSTLRQDMLIKKGAEALRKQDYAEAMSYYQKIKKVNAKNEAVYLYGADVYLAQDSWEEALWIIDEGITVTGSERLQNRWRYIRENVVVVSVKATFEDEFIDDEGNGFELECEYDKWGNVIASTSYDCNGSINYRREYEYDNRGNLVKEVTHNGYGSAEPTYDSNGNVVKSVLYNDDGSIGNWIELMYDSNGNLVQVVNLTSAYEVVYDWRFTYDSHGNMLKQTLHDEEGNVRYWDECEYDNCGNVIKIVSYDEDGSIWHWNEHEYDSYGNEIKYVSYDATGSINNYREYEYRYNSHGNMTEIICYYEDSNAKCTTELENDLNGRCIKATCSDGTRIAFDNEYTYVGDILCLTDITPLTGILKMPNFSYMYKGKLERNAYFNMRRVPTYQQSARGNFVTYRLVANGDRYKDIPNVNIVDALDALDKLSNKGKAEWEVIGETTEFYQLANGWYVAKDQPGITFIEQ